MGGLARDLVFEIVRTVHVLGFLLVDVHAILLVDLGVPLHARGRSREEAVGGTAFHDRDGRGHIFFLAHKLILTCSDERLRSFQKQSKKSESWNSL